MTHKIDATKGSLWKNILLLSIPLILSNVLQVLFNMADIAVVGQFSGPEALGSVGSTAILITLFIGFLIGMGNGVNVVVARYVGAKDNDKIKKAMNMGFFICLGVGLLILLAGLISSRAILELLKTKNDLIDGAVLYLNIYLVGMPAMAIYNFGNACYSAMGNTKKPLIILGSAGVINVLLNVIFVVILNMDVFGVGLASVIAQYLSAVLVMLSLILEKNELKFGFSNLTFDKEEIKHILVLGIPSALQYAIFAIANLFIQSAVNSFDTVMVEGNSAAMNADSLVYDVMAAFYLACSTFMSQNLGAKQKDRIIKSYFIAMTYSFVIGLAMGLALVLFGNSFLRLFTSDEACIEAGMKRLTIMGFSYGFSAFMDCTIAASRGLGKSVIPTIIVILGSCVFRIIWIYTVFQYYHTFTGLYLLYIFSWIITGLAEIAYFSIIYKRVTRYI